MASVKAGLPGDRVPATIREEIAHLNDADEAAVVKATAALTVLATRNEATVELFSDLVPKLSNLILTSSNMHIQRNSCAALTAVIGANEALCQSAVSSPQLISQLISMTEDGKDVPTRLNAVSALGEMAQIGVGLAAVRKAGGIHAILAMLDGVDIDDRLEESVADVVCAFATEPDTHTELVRERVIEKLGAVLLRSESREVQVRVLMAFGMLLGADHLDNQARLAGIHGVVPRLLRLARSEDLDIKVIAQTLFRTLASNPTLRPAVEAELREAPTTHVS